MCRAERFRTSLQFRTVPYRHFYAALDACKVSDYIVFILSTTKEVEEWGDTLLRTLQAQGMPEVVTVVAENPSLDAKTRSGIHKSLLSFIQYFVPSQTRVFDLHAQSDRLNAVRSLSEGKPRDVKWREGRSYMLSEDLSWEDGLLKVTGVARGAPLSANRLVHIPEHGDFQIEKVRRVSLARYCGNNVSQIVSAPLPRRSKTSMDVEPTVLAEPDPEELDSLVSTNDPDDLSNEQTWPTEEEMNGTLAAQDPSIPDASAGTTPKRVKKIPKGWSEYQAAWIADETDEEAEGEDEEENEMEEDEEMVELVEDPKESSRTEDFHDLDMEEEERQ